MIFKEFIAEMLHNLLLELLNTTGQTFSKWDCEKAIISTASCLNSTTIICQTNEHNDTVAQLGIFLISIHSALFRLVLLSRLCSHRSLLSFVATSRVIIKTSF